MSNNKFYIKKLDIPWENPEVLKSFDDGWTIVRNQTPWDYCMESWFLDHCLCSKHFDTFEIGHRVFSVRDPLNIPHATILGLLPNKVSPYALCIDLLTDDYFQIGGENMRILQVRGREDALARQNELLRVTDWLGVHYSKELGRHSMYFGDDDNDYHERYLLPERHTWESWQPTLEVDHIGIKEGWLTF